MASEDAIKAGEIHRQVRKYVYGLVKPPCDAFQITQCIQGEIKRLTKDYPNAGIAFPVGFSINDCAAHWTPSPTDNRTLLSSDIVKVDYGVHINGCIIDSAFTLYWGDEPPVVAASREALDAAIKMACPDTLLSDIGENVEEIITSYDVKPVKTLNGHQILPYRIHGPKIIPNISFPQYRERMSEGEYFAIEPFASTGAGITVERGETTHYMVAPEYVNSKISSSLKQYMGMPFSSTWGLPKKFQRLVKQKIVQAYPPLYDVGGGIVAQFEHTVYIGKTAYVLS
uniref:Metallopeptidase family M24 n=1 Tax=Megaviridae environmental sample TaxID=1737588 RepID=A0A5J6VIF4_9VIRU|nr:MAG: metallopeptidase family M24 [Megaviridae environmental sample]